MALRIACNQEIQEWVSTNCGFRPEVAWIAYCKITWGLPASVRDHPLAKCAPCPADKHDAIIAAFRHFDGPELDPPEPPGPDRPTRE